MDFLEIANARYSCRKYDTSRDIEAEKLERVLEAARLAPSACNGQPYRVTVCSGEVAKEVAACVTGMVMNRFAKDAPILLVISEEAYVASAALGAKVKKNDYRSIDIGIVSAYITAACTQEGLGSCILGWFDDEKIRQITGLTRPVRLVITVGYAADGDKAPAKKRKSMDELVTELK